MAKPGALTEAQVRKFKKATFNPEVVDEIEDADGVGIMVAQYLGLDGGAIIRAFYSALEDANFHAENKVLQDAFPWAFRRRG